MRGIDELDHYDLLEVARGATQAEIDRAYRAAQRIYADGSLALYSIFENVDAAAIRERFDEAYRVLSDAELRADYDQEISRDEKISEKTLTRSAAGSPGGQAPLYAGQVGAEIHASHGGYAGVGQTNKGEGEAGHFRQAPLFDGSDSVGGADRAGGYEAIDSVEGAVEEYDAIEDDGRGEFDGVRLRRNRLFRGYELDDISDVTKVNPNHLRNIEEENFKELPADVYVRGFVTAYAKTIGLDPKVVVPSYMARVEQSRGNPRRGSFLARR